MLGGLSPAGVNVDLLAVVEARVVVRVSGRVGEVRARVAADEAEAVDLGGTHSEILSVLKTFAHWQRASQWRRLGGARTKRQNPPGPTVTRCPSPTSRVSSLLLRSIRV